MSDYHPETWLPLWTVQSILNGLLSFMLEDTPTLGSITTSDSEKRKFALQSMRFNQHIPQFKKLFPELLKDIPPETPKEITQEKNETQIPTEPEVPMLSKEVLLGLIIVLFLILSFYV